MAAIWKTIYSHGAAFLYKMCRYVIVWALTNSIHIQQQLPALLEGEVVWSYTNAICTRRFEATLWTSTSTLSHMLAFWLICGKQLFHELPGSWPDVAETPAPLERYLYNLVRCYVENIANPTIQEILQWRSRVSKSNKFLFKMLEMVFFFFFITK